jgi:hypothetical protein
LLSVDQVEELVVGVLFDSVVLDSVFLEVVSTQLLLLDGVGRPPCLAEEEVVLTSLMLLLVDQES